MNDYDNRQLTITKVHLSPLYIRDSKMCTLANSEDPDEMLHFIRVCTVCLDKNDLQRKEYCLFGNNNL